MDTGAKMLIGLAAAGGLGFVAYEYWYKPEKQKEAMRVAAMQMQAQNPGMTYNDALGRVGALVCQGFGAKYGMPPQASGPLCNEVGALASQLVKQVPNLVKGTLGAVGGGVTEVGKGVASAATSLGKVPFQIAGSVAQDVGKGIKSVGRDVGKFFSSIF